MAQKHIDEVSGVETTGHEWDGIRELNNPMPRLGEPTVKQLAVFVHSLGGGE